MKKKILCMGSINMDLVMYMDHMPLPGETVRTDNFQTFSGGKCGNQAMAASMLGGVVSCLTKLGDDDFSRILLEGQKSGGVDVRHVITVPGKTAGIAMIRVDQSGQNSISFTPGANGLLKAEDIEKSGEAFLEAQILLITMEIDPQAVYAAMRLAKSHGMTVVLDPAPVPAAGIPDEILSMADYIKPNESEAGLLTGISVSDVNSAFQALEILRDKGVAYPMVTLGENGAAVFLGNKPFHLEPLKVDSIDSTAAGDIFLGAFTTALSQGRPYGECLEFAGTAAALSTAKKGAQDSIPARTEVEYYLQ